MPRPGYELRFPLPVRNRPMIEEALQGERQERWKVRTVLLGRIWRILLLTFVQRDGRHSRPLQTRSIRPIGGGCTRGLQVA